MGWSSALKNARLRTRTNYSDWSSALKNARLRTRTLRRSRQKVETLGRTPMNYSDWSSALKNARLRTRTLRRPSQKVETSRTSRNYSAHWMNSRNETWPIGIVKAWQRTKTFNMQKKMPGQLHQPL